MLIQDISSPSKYKLSKIEISFSPPYFAQIDSVKKFKFSRQDITWSEYSCNHCQHYPTFYLQSFITICSSIFKKKKHHFTSYRSSHTKPDTSSSQVSYSTQNIGEIEVLIRSVRSFDQNKMKGGIACNNLTKNCGSKQAKSKRLKKCWIRPSPGE